MGSLSQKAIDSLATTCPRGTRGQMRQLLENIGIEEVWDIRSGELPEPMAQILNSPKAKERFVNAARKAMAHLTR